jgi:hypothetical protein
MGRQYVRHNSPSASRAATLSIFESAHESITLHRVVVKRSALAAVSAIDVHRRHFEARIASFFYAPLIANEHRYGTNAVWERTACPLRSAIIGIGARNFWGSENFTNFRLQLREKEVK